MMCVLMTAPLSAQTTGCDSANLCTYTFILHGEWDDSWVGSSFTILQNDSAVANVTLAEGLYTDVVTVMLCNNVSTSLVWNTGGSYDNECSFVMLDHEGDTIYATSGTPSGTLTTFTTNCMPPCPRPADITVTDISSNSAVVGWTVAGTEDAWNLEYKVNTDSTWTVIPVTTNPYTLTGLATLSYYDVRVQANCGSGEVSDYRATSFATAGCDAADQCTFTFTLTDSYGDGWSGGSLSVIQNGVTVATLELVNDSLAVETVPLCGNYSTSIVWNPGQYANEAGFSVIGPNVSFTHNGMHTYTTFTFNTNCTLEPIAVTDPASGIEQTTATLNGTISNPDNVTITAQGFKWKPVSATNYTVLNATGTTMTATLNNLTPNTDYTYRAFVTTANGTHYGDDVTFTTLDVEPCEVPANLHTTNIENEAIAIAWDANTDVVNWNVRYRPTTVNQWTNITVNTNSHTITGLTGNTTYEIKVQANCGFNNLSDWSDPISVKTTDVGIENHLANSVTLYPNPANDIVNVQCTMYNVQLVEVIDVYGKVINTVNVTDNPTRINVSGLAAGMYFVRVSTEEGAVTKTFVKR